MDIVMEMALKIAVTLLISGAMIFGTLVLISIWS